MRFSLALISTTLLVLVAAVPEPQTGAQTTAAALALESYISAQLTNSAALSVASALATNPSAASVIESVGSSITSAIAAGQTSLGLVPISVFPTQFQSYFSSVYAAEFSILNENGFGAAVSSVTSQLGAATSTSTSSGAGTAPTAVFGIGAMAGVALGVAGLL